MQILLKKQWYKPCLKIWKHSLQFITEIVKYYKKHYKHERNEVEGFP